MGTGTKLMSPLCRRRDASVLGFGSAFSDVPKNRGPMNAVEVTPRGGDVWGPDMVALATGSSAGSNHFGENTIIL